MGLFSKIIREYRYVSDLVRVLRAVKNVDPNSTNLVPDDLERSCDKFTNNLAFIEGNQSWTYNEFDAYANRVANWAISKGIEAGDTVAIFARNRLQYVAIWYGLSKVGVIPALLNFQLSASALAHCLNISDAKTLILDYEMAQAWQSAQDMIESDIAVFAAFGAVSGVDSFDAAIDAQRETRPDRSHRAGIVGSDQVMKMFTSGTTGLPKAAKVTHVRAQNYLRGFAAASRSGPKDRMMMVLPLYHATGGLCGVGTALSTGGAVIVRPRFSASMFWDEAVEYGATLFMYVGELCRFLLTAPPHPLERSHSIRHIIGNGLRPEVWPGFVSRFDILAVTEFYGATEGNVSLLNINGRMGAIGRVPDYLKFRFNMEVAAYDVESGTNPRGPDGFCLMAKTDEAGELLGKIDPNNARFRFDGYENEEATKKKILRNVTEKGDVYFRTGDLVRKDRDGYIYFVDRIGDTYRWKAENVATGEVAAALSKFDGIIQANVYGVIVPGCDGRAGMASLVVDKSLDMGALYTHIQAELPHYAQPVFLRISRESDTTGTFKFKKTNLVKDGFDPDRVYDPLFVASPESEKYEPIDAAMYRRIQSSDLRL